MEKSSKKINFEEKRREKKETYCVTVGMGCCCSGC